VGGCCLRPDDLAGVWKGGLKGCSQRAVLFPRMFPQQTTCMKSRLSLKHNLLLYYINRPLDRLCGLVVRVLGYRSGGPGSIPGTNRKKNSSGSGTGSTQPREYN
jgi:hypothetical protein